MIYLIFLLYSVVFSLSVEGQTCQPGSQPIGDSSDLLILSDSSSIRTLTLSGVPSLLAGVPGSSGYVNGAGTSAQFNSPGYLAVTPDGSGVMVADYGNNLIRRVNLSSGAVTTYAGSVYSTFTAAAENVDGSGSVATFFHFKGLSFSKISNRLIVSVPFSLIRIVTFPVPVVSTILGSINSVWGVVDGVLGVTGTQSGLCSYFISPDETFYISSDISNRNIRRLDVSTAQVTTIAGSPGITKVSGCSDGFGTNAKFSFPGKVLFSPSGQEIFIADTMQNGVRRMNLATTEVTTLAGTSTACASGVSSPDVNILSRIFDMAMSSDGLYIYASPIGFTGIKRLEISTQLVTLIGASSSLPAGAYGVALRPALTGCLQCVPGTYSLDGSVCQGCPAGSFCNSTSSTACPSGIYPPLHYKSSHHYIHCMARFFIVSALLLISTTFAASQNCSSTFPSYSGICTSVTPGVKISATYSTSCPANSRTVIDNATAVTDCKCIEGYYGNVTSVSTPNQCLMCAPGTYSVAVGQTSNSTCQQCPLGSYCASVSASPVQCNSSYVCPAGSISQSSCPSGFYCSTPSSKLSCSIGGFCPAGSTTDSPCPAGSFCQNTSTISVCAAGTYCPVRSISPISCVLGQYCPVNSSSANACPSGSFCSNASTSSVCTAGTYCPSGSTSSLQCVFGQYCPANSSFASQCPTGFYCPNASVSIASPSGYSSAGGTEEPQSMSAGMKLQFVSPGVPLNQGDIFTVKLFANSGGVWDLKMWGMDLRYDYNVLSYVPGSIKLADGIYSGTIITDVFGIAVISATVIPGSATTSTRLYVGNISFSVNSGSFGVLVQGEVACSGVYMLNSGGNQYVTDAQCQRNIQNVNGTFVTTTNPPGYYYSSNLSQTACPVGYFCPGGQAIPWKCDCFAGTYPSQVCSSTVAPLCTGCVAGTYTDSANSYAACLSCTVCQPGTFILSTCTVTSNTICWPCSNSNTYSNTSGAPSCTSCSVCPVGTYRASVCNVTSNTVCAFCLPGFTCAGGSASPVVCPAGSYCLGSTATSNLCSVGGYCPVGSSTDNPCPAGSVCSNTSTISVCAAGTYCPLRSTSPLACSSGQFCPVNSSSASQCLLGFSCPNTSSQIACGLTNYCPASSISQTKCPAGSYCSSPSSIQNCTIGSYCPTGSIVNSSCMAGSYCNTTITQVNCSMGSYCPSGSTVMNPCPAGSVCSSPSTISTCALGSFCPQGSTNQTLCAAGNMCPNSTVQLQCPAGTVCATGSTAATACATGAYCAPGSTTSTTCPAGSLCTSSSSITVCPANSFCGAGSSVAVVCPPPSVSLAGSVAFTNCSCPAGTYGRVISAAAASCLACPQGAFCSGVAQQCLC